jgi:hypothetical protein
VSGRAGELAIRISLVVMGVFTALPVLALVQPGQLESSYGVTDPDPMVLTLLQHRGMLQLLAGAALVWAAVRPAVRVPISLGVVAAKTTALALTVIRPDAQAQASAVIQGFDIACVIALLAIAVASRSRRPSIRLRERARP